MIVDQTLFRGVEIEAGIISDVRVSNGVIREIATTLPSIANEREVDGRGGALLPGLHDHHLHLLSQAASLSSVRCGPDAARNRSEMAVALQSAARTAEPGTWIRAVGYHENVAGPLDRGALDLMVRDWPVRVQHRSGALWIVNSTGVAALDLDASSVPGIERDAAGIPTGRLWRLDHWLRARVGPDRPLDLSLVGKDLAALGITGVTDATPDLSDPDIETLALASSLGALPQRIHLLGAGNDVMSRGRLTVGPRKILISDENLPSFDSLRQQITANHQSGRSVAVHCVTRESLLLTVAVLAEIGPLPSDRIEHAAVVPPGIAEELARLRLRVVTQPAFVADRGDDYLRDVSPDDQPFLYPYASLLRAGVLVAPSSDAPFGSMDPWRIMGSARDRTTGSGAVLGRNESVPAAAVLNGYLSRPEEPGGDRRRVAVGANADLCLLADPRAHADREPSRSRVRLTMCAGHIVHEPESN